MKKKHLQKQDDLAALEEALQMIASEYHEKKKRLDVEQRVILRGFRDALSRKKKEAIRKKI